ncbi:hypothetical protein EG328_003893 [Venturia inaequalis]|uniref:Uncharacterized protein n=1 Tax=Venturia inaequalis TaxID=5025 RepID=A0A8H3YWE4_VENIN|nr:hypothetical protein EG328_003893 [Venturia inaequalis]
MRRLIYNFWQPGKRILLRANCLAQAFFNEAPERAKELDNIFQETREPVGPIMDSHPRFKTKDAPVIKVLRDAGAVFYCKTNNPQILMHLEMNPNEEALVDASYKPRENEFEAYCWFVCVRIVGKKWNLTDCSSQTLALKGESGLSCQIHRRLLEKRAKSLVSYSKTLSVAASPRTLLLFSNWIYTGKISLSTHEEHCSAYSPAAKCLLHSHKFEAYCNAAIEDDTLTPCMAKKWGDRAKILSKCTVPALIQYRCPTQSHMDWLVDLYIFASTYNISPLRHDTLHALAVVTEIGGELPNHRILNKAFSANSTSQLSKYLKDVYDLNWSPTIATNFKAEKNEQLHSEVVEIFLRNLVEDLETSQMEKETLSQRMNATKAKQDKRNREIIEELADSGRVLTQANAQATQIAETEKALADAKARIAELEKENTFYQGQKRAREDGDMVPEGSVRGNDGQLDASEMFSQSLKKPRRTLRPKTSGASNIAPS